MKTPGIKCVYSLEQETPLIHFQYDQAGACLRASEVKPQLDRFIIMKLGGKALMRNDTEMKKWFISDMHNALNYRMTIHAHGNAQISTETEAAIKAIRKPVNLLDYMSANDKSQQQYLGIDREVCERRFLIGKVAT